MAEFTAFLPGYGDPLDKVFIGEQIIYGRKLLSDGCKSESYKTSVSYARVCSCKRARITFDAGKLFEKKK